MSGDFWAGIFLGLLASMLTGGVLWWHLGGKPSRPTQPGQPNRPNTRPNLTSTRHGIGPSNPAPPRPMKVPSAQDVELFPWQGLPDDAIVHGDGDKLLKCRCQTCGKDNAYLVPLADLGRPVTVCCDRCNRKVPRFVTFSGFHRMSQV